MEPIELVVNRDVGDGCLNQQLIVANAINPIVAAIHLTRSCIVTHSGVAACEPVKVDGVVSVASDKQLMGIR